MKELTTLDPKAILSPGGPRLRVASKPTPLQSVSRDHTLCRVAVVSRLASSCAGRAAVLLLAFLGLIAPSAMAQSPNLALRFDQVGDRLFVGAESLVVLSVSNAGPTAAAAVRITNVFSVGTVVRSVTPAPMLVVDQTYVFDLGSLGGQSNRTLQFVLTSFDPTRVCAQASASATGLPPNSSSWCGAEFRSVNCFPQLAGAVAWINADGTSASFDTAQPDPQQFQGPVGYASGISGRAFSFDGSNTVAQPALALSPGLFDGSFALAVWLRTTQLVTSATLAQFSSLGGLNPPRFGLRLNRGRPEFYVADLNAGGTPDVLLARPTFAADDTWHQLVGVRDLATAELRLYVDGQRAVRLPVSSHSDSTWGPISPIPLSLGARRDSLAGPVSEWFAGLLDDVVLLPRAVSDAEVGSWYAVSLGTNTGCSGPALSPATLSPALAGQPFWAALRLFPVTPNTQWWLDPASVPSNLCWTTTGELRGTPGAGQYSFQFGIADGSGPTNFVTRPLSVTASAPPGLVAFWPGDGNGGESVNGQTVQAFGLGTGFIDGVHGGAFRLLGETNSFASASPLAKALSGNAARTLGCWIWREPGQSDGGVLAGQRFGTPFDFALVQGSSGTLSLLGRGAGGLAVSVDGPKLLSGRWTHCAATYDGAALNLYMDGQLVTQQTITGLDTRVGSTFWIGGANSGSGFAGAVDDVALFNRALSAAELASMSAGGIPAASPLPPGGLPPAVNALVSTQLPDALVADPYSVDLAPNFCGPLARYQVVSGIPPVSLTITNRSLLAGVPLQLGHFSFTVRGSDLLGRSADVILGLEVRLRPPRFTQIPSPRDLELGQVVWLTAQTDIPAALQWFFNGVELPGQTNNDLLEPNFAIYNAGTYQVRARNAAGDTVSPPADMHLKQAPAERDGVALAKPVFTPSRRLQLQFTTVPGRGYKIQRAANDELTANTSWLTLTQVTATDYTTTHTDDQTTGVKSRFYRIVEEPPPQPAGFTIADPAAFVALDASGRPQVGVPVGSPAAGLLNPFEMRFARAQLPASLGLLAHFGSGAQVTQTNGQTQLSAQHVQFFFGADSPIQFDEVVEVNRANAQILSGPISVQQLETLLNKPGGTGLRMTAFGVFHFVLARGTFDGNRIKGAQVRFVPDAVLNLPLPELSGDYPDFALELDAQGALRLPFSGSIPLHDGTASPATLTVPATKPIVLELRPDGHVGLDGSAQLEFAGDGPKFGVEFSFDDPQYRLRLTASKVSFPPLASADEVLPVPGDVPVVSDDIVLNPVEERLIAADHAALNLAAFTASDAAPAASATSARAFVPAAQTTPAPLTSPTFATMLDPNTGDLLELWRSIVAVKGYGPYQAQIDGLAGPAARMASASEDWAKVARMLAALVQLEKAGRDANQDFSAIQAAAETAAEATQRLVDTTACGDYTPVTINVALSNLLFAARTLQQIGADGTGRATDLETTAAQLLECYAQAYLANLGVVSGVFGLTPDSPIAAMQRYEALTHVRQLVELRQHAQALGVLDTFGAPMPEGLAQLSLRVWQELNAKLNTALAADDRRTYMYLVSEVADLQPVMAQGVLPSGRSELASLPDTAALGDLFNRIFQNGPVEIAAQDAYGQSLPQLRDDLKRFMDLLSYIPDSVTEAPAAVQRNYQNLVQRFNALVPTIGSTAVFSTSDLVALAEAGIFAEELRLRFSLSDQNVWQSQQINLVIVELANRVRSEQNVKAAHDATAALLDASARARHRANGQGPLPQFASLLPRSVPSSARADAYRTARQLYLTNATLVIAAERELAATQWTLAEDNRQKGLGPLSADMLLPGGIEVDEVAGELAYNARLRTLRGTFSGKLRLPNQGLSLDLINASFYSGGAFDVSLAGAFDVPHDKTLVHLEIPTRHPLHLALDLNRHLTLEGGLRAKLKNGMAFEAWASLDDPLYTFGASAKNLRFGVGTSVTLNLPVPDDSSLDRLTDDQQPLALDYLGAAASTLEPLINDYASTPGAASVRSRAKAAGSGPTLLSLAPPPEFDLPQVSSEADPIVAGALAFRLLAAKPQLFGLASLEAATQVITNTALVLRREVERSHSRLTAAAGELLETGPSNNDEDRLMRRGTGRKTLRQVRDLASAFTNGLGVAYAAATPGRPQWIRDLLGKTYLQTQLAPLKDVLAEVRQYADGTQNLEILQDRESVNRSLELALLVLQIEEIELFTLLGDTDARGLSSFVLAARQATFTRIGLSANGTIPDDTSMLEAQAVEDLVEATAEILQQEEILQHLQLTHNVPGAGQSNFAEALKSLYVARRNLIVADILAIKQERMPPPLDLPIVAQVKILTRQFIETLETENFFERIGVGNGALAGQVKVLDLDGTRKVMDAAEASASLMRYMDAQVGGVTDFLDQAGGGTAQERRILRAYVQPEVGRWLRGDKNKGDALSQLVVPIRALKRVPNSPLDAPTLQLGLSALLSYAQDSVKAEVQRGLRLTSANAVDHLAQIVALAELIDLVQSQGQRDAQLTQLQADVLRATGNPTETLTALASDQNAWWLSERAGRVLLRALRDPTHTGSAVFQGLLKQEYGLLRHSLRGLLIQLRAQTQTGSTSSLALRAPAATAPTPPTDFNLPGGLIINDVHGELTFNRQTKYVRGDFGGRLEFPGLQDSSIQVADLSVDTDGNFAFSALASFPVPVSVPGFTSPHFKGTLTATGQKVLGATFDGTLILTGSGQLDDGVATIPGTTPTNLTASVRYALEVVNGQLQWKLSVSLSGAMQLQLGDDFVIFKEAIAGSVGNTGGGGTVRVGGTAGIIRKDKTRPGTTPDDFAVVVQDLDLESGVSQQENGTRTTVTLHSGKLRLPPLFSNLSSNLCGASPQDGPEIDVQTSPITAVFDSSGPSFGLSGALTFRNFGFSVPVLPGVQAAVCTAEFVFNSDQLPYLSNVTASLQLPLPNDQTNYLDFTNGVFTLEGLPTGTITIRSNLVVASIAGVTVTIIGRSHPTNSFSCRDGTGLTVSTPPGEVGQFRLFGGMVITLPASMMTGASNDAVSAAACGYVTMTVHSDRPPTFDLGLDALQIKADSMHLGGANGLVLSNADLQLVGLSNLFHPTADNPFLVKVNGKVTLPNGPGLGLSGAVMRVFDPNRLPDFSIQELFYDGSSWTLLGKLPVEITKVVLAFIDPIKPFPDRLNPTNVKLTVSGGVFLPNKDKAVLGGQVDNLIITFGSDGFPKPPSIDGFELIIQPGKLKIPPINDLGGRIRIGGLQGSGPEAIYLVGRLSGSYSSYKLAFLAAFTLDGPVGMCLDVNAGAAGIPLGPTTLIISGASGGISFLNNAGDPCDFDSYFTTDPATGNKVINSSTHLLAALKWADLKAVADRMEGAAQRFVKSSALALPSGPPRAAKASATATPPADQLTIAGTNHSPITITCPAKCPPATVNILCQPHPDALKYPNRVIFKFSAIEEHTIAPLLPFTRESLAHTQGDASALAQQYAPQIAQTVTNFVRDLTPQVLDTVQPVDFRNQLIEAQQVALQLLYTTVTETIVMTFSNQPATEFYDRFIDLIGAGIPCLDITEALAGRVSQVVIGSFAYLQGRVIISSAGSAGVNGTVYVLGMPIGDARGFVAFTDENGDPNPSLCAQLNLGFGPLEAGGVDLSMECRQCVTKILGVFPAVAQHLSEELFRDIVSRVAPSVNDVAHRNRADLINELTHLPPDQMQAVLSGFFAELMGRAPSALPTDLPQIVANALAPVLQDIDPKVVLCGEVQPRLFGFPLTPTAIAKLGAQVNREGYIGSFAFSPSFLCQPYPILPPLDQATLSWDYRARDPLFFLVGGLDGSLSSPEKALEFAKQQIDYALEHTVFAIDYQFHPLGLHVADAGVRLILPDLLHHPVLTDPPRKPAWELDPSLPSPQRVLIQAASMNLLGNAFGWHGDTSDFANIFPADVYPSEHAALSQSLDLRKDYFPYGGLLGGGQLAIPLILTESPTAWLPLLAAIQTNPSPVDKIVSVIHLVQDHVLQTQTNGEIAFYLPAPNPPMLYSSTTGQRLATDAAGKIQGVAVSSLTAGQVLDSIKQFDPAKFLTLGDIYPRQYAFFEGHLSNSFLGIPIGAGRISARFTPPPGSSELVTLEATAPADSFLGRWSGGRPVDLLFTLGSVPTNSIESIFTGMLDTLVNATNNHLPTLDDAVSLQQQAFAALASALPKAAFTAHLPDFPLPLLADPRLPPTAWVQNPVICGYSPMFDTNTPLTTLSNRIRHDGGLFLAGSFHLLPVSGSLDVALAAESGHLSDLYAQGVIQGDAELGLSPQANGSPRLSGSLRNVNVVPPAPFASAAFQAQGGGEFDTAGQPYYARAYGSMPPRTLTSPDGRTLFSLRPNGTSALTADFALAADSGFNLILSPAILQAPALGVPALLLHGNGNVTNPIVIGTGTFSAQATFAGSPGAPAIVAKKGGLSQSFDLVVPVNNTSKVLARISGLPATAFKLTGSGLDDFSLKFGFNSSPDPLTVTLLPNDNLHLPPGLGSFSLRAGPSGALLAKFSCDSHGAFDFTASLAMSAQSDPGFPQFPGFDASARVHIRNDGVRFDGTFNGNPAWFEVHADGSTDSGGELRIGPWNWGCLSFSAVVDAHGSFHANPASSGFDLSGGFRLSLCNLSPNLSAQSFDLPNLQSLHLNADGSFCTNIAWLAGPALRLAGYPINLKTLALCGTRSDGNNPDEHLRLDFTGSLDLSPVLSTEVKGFISYTNTSGGQVVNSGTIHLELDAQGQPPPLLGLNFATLAADFTASYGSAPRLSVHGQLPWSFLPPALRTLSGTLQPQNRLDLNNGAGTALSSLGFPLSSVTSSLNYQPGTYSNVVRASGPAGYWRMDDSIYFDVFGRGVPHAGMADASSTGGAPGTYHPAPALFGNAAPVSGQDGAFESASNKSVLFDGVNGYATIAMPATDPTRFNHTGGFSIELWFRRQSDVLLATGVPQSLAGHDAQWDLQLARSGSPAATRLLFGVAGVANPQSGLYLAPLASRAAIADTTWHHVLAVFDGAAQYLYLDGRLDNWQITRGGPATLSSPISLAALATSEGVGYFFSGWLDEVAVYDRALAPLDVLDHYLAGGRGALRFASGLGPVAGFALDADAGLKGIIGSDGSMALAMSLPRNASLGGFSLPGFSGNILKTSGGDALLAFSAALPPPPLPGVSGSDFQVRGFLTSDGSFNFSGAGDHLGLLQSFALEQLTLSASLNNGVFSSSLGGDLRFPSYLGGETLPLSGGLNPLQLGSAGGRKTITIGPGRFDLAFNLDSTQISGSGAFYAGQSQFGAGFSASASSVQFTANGDTGWQGASGQVSEAYCTAYSDLWPHPCTWWSTRLVNKSFSPPYMRLEWNLLLTAQPSGPNACFSGRFRVVSDTDHPDRWPNPILDLGSDRVGCLQPNSDGTLLIGREGGDFKSFLPKLW